MRKRATVPKRTSLSQRRSAYESQRNKVRSLRNDLKKKEKIMKRIEETIGKDMMERCAKQETLIKDLFSTINSIIKGEQDGDAQSSILLDQVDLFYSLPVIE